MTTVYGWGGAGHFNGSLRDECLNVNWFASLAKAQGLFEAWR